MIKLKAIKTILMTITAISIFCCNKDQVITTENATVENIQSENSITNLETQARDILISNNMLEQNMTADDLNSSGYYLYLDQKYEDASTVFRYAIQKDPVHQYAVYNLACVLAILKGSGAEISSSEIVDYLKKSLEIDQSWIDKIRTDPDLDPIRESELFIDLLQGYGNIELYHKLLEIIDGYWLISISGELSLIKLQKQNIGFSPDGTKIFLNIHMITDVEMTLTSQIIEYIDSKNILIDSSSFVSDQFSTIIITKYKSDYEYYKEAYDISDDYFSSARSKLHSDDIQEAISNCSNSIDSMVYNSKNQILMAEIRSESLNQGITSATDYSTNADMVISHLLLAHNFSRYSINDINLSYRIKSFLNDQNLNNYFDDFEDIKYFGAFCPVLPISTNNSFYHWTSESSEQRDYYGAPLYLIGTIKKDNSLWYIGLNRYFSRYNIFCWQGDFLGLKIDPDFNDLELDDMMFGDSTMTYGSEELKAYSQPSLNSDYINIPPVNQVLGTLNREDRRWYYIFYKDDFYWVNSDDSETGR